MPRKKQTIRITVTRADADGLVGRTVLKSAWDRLVAVPEAEQKAVTKLPCVLIHFDGATRLNGQVTMLGGYGFQAYRYDGETTTECGHGYGPSNEYVALAGATSNTNNVSEYAALIEAVKWWQRAGHPTGSLWLRGDSRLVVDQVNGDCQAHEPHLLRLRTEARRLRGESVGAGNRVYIDWVPRKQNARADELSKLGEAATSPHYEYPA